MANPHPFANKVIAITGAAGGIGLATAHYLAARGAILSISDISPSDLASAVDALHRTYPDTPLLGRTVDVGSSASVNAWIDATTARFGRLDGAANVAGTVGRRRETASTQKLWEVDEDEYDFIQRVNAKGVFNCLRAELLAMGVAEPPPAASVDGQAPAPLGSAQGAIVNVASVAGVTGRPNAGPYTASKHAVIGLTRTAAREAGEKGIRVNAVAPGYVDTPMMVYIKEEVESLCLKRAGSAAEVAGLIGWLLGGEGSSYVTGQVYEIMGGWPGVV